MNYKTISSNVREIKEGMTESDVLRLVGEPDEKKGNKWNYDFMKYGIPKISPGLQIFLGVTITFKKKLFVNKMIVKEIQIAWIDSTGSPEVYTKD